MIKICGIDGFRVDVEVNFTLYNAMKAKREVQYICTLSLTTALDGGGLLTSRLCRFSPGNSPLHIFMGGWVVEAKNLPYRDFSPGLPRL
jgi:hypothetical protein